MLDWFSPKYESYHDWLKRIRREANALKLKAGEGKRAAENLRRMLGETSHDANIEQRADTNQECDTDGHTGDE